MSSPFALTTPPGGTRPHNTAEAVANLARDQGSNVAAIYALSSLGDVQDHRLSTIPDAWTVTVKVDDSGRDDPDLLIGGPGNLAFDQRGYAWGTNNVIQDTPNSSQAIVVLEPNGQPADGSRQPAAGARPFRLSSAEASGDRIRGHRRSDRLRLVRQFRMGSRARAAIPRPTEISGSRASPTAASTCSSMETSTNPSCSDRMSGAALSTSPSPGTERPGFRTDSARRRAALQATRS